MLGFSNLISNNLIINNLTSNIFLVQFSFLGTKITKNYNLNSLQLV